MSGWCFQTQAPDNDSGGIAIATPSADRVSNGGVIALLWSEASWPLVTQSSGLNFETIRLIDSSSFTSVANTYFAASIAPSQWSTQSGSPTVTKAGTVLDGHPVFNVTCPEVGAACDMTVLEAQLVDYPSLAGQTVYFALQLRVGDGPSIFQLMIQDGSGSPLRMSSNATLKPEEGWQTHRSFATLAWSGNAMFTVRLFGATVMQVAAVAILPVGQAWSI